MSVFDESLLIDTWIHSHEENVADLRTFRRKGFAFPPSRGRRQFTLEANGVLVDGFIRRQDGVDSVDGTWVLEAAKLVFISAATGQITQSWDVVSFESDRLVLRSANVEVD